MEGAPLEGAKNNGSCCAELMLSLLRFLCGATVPGSVQVEAKSKTENDGNQVTKVSKLACNVVCQRFRNCQPITCELLTSCFDPKLNNKLRLNTLQPHHLLVRTHDREEAYISQAVRDS